MCQLKINYTILIPSPLRAMVPFRVERVRERVKTSLPPPLNPLPPGAGKFLRSSRIYLDYETVSFAEVTDND
jgi:hypothetical protein